MRVMLLSPPFVKNFMRNGRWDVIGQAGGQWYPIWLAYCTGLLEKHGHEALLLDAQVDGLSVEEVVERAEGFGPEMVVMAYSNKALDNDLDIALKLLRATMGRVVLVGASASSTAEQVVKRNPMLKVAVGEYDFTVLELADGWHPANVKGLVWHNGERVMANHPREPVTAEQLKVFPFVTGIYREHLNLHNYRQADQFFPYIDLFTGRGCSWGRCSFCLFPNTISKGAGYRTRPMADVMAELVYIKQAMPQVKEVFIQDDTFPAQRCQELSELLLAADLKITWSCYSRATSDMTYALFKQMKRSGCRTLHVGYESANNLLLGAMSKGISCAGAERFTRDAVKAGLMIVADFLVGLPGETRETIEETVEWAKTLPVQRYTFSLPKPYPGTPFHKYLAEGGYLKDGHPNYPKLSSEEIYCLNKWAYRQVYFNPRYLLRMAAQPREWDRLIGSAAHAVPYFFNREPESHKELEW